MVVVVERKEKGRVRVFYLCPQALMRGGNGRKNILHHQGELEKIFKEKN